MAEHYCKTQQLLNQTQSPGWRRRGRLQKARLLALTINVTTQLMLNHMTETGKFHGSYRTKEEI